MSVDFEPVRIGSRRRGFDPLKIVVTAVVFGLLVALVKPWESEPSARGPGPSSAAPANASPGTPAGSPAPGVAVASTAPRTRANTPLGTRPPTPTWSDVSPAIRPHDTWGVRAILTRLAADETGILAPPYVESWSSTSVDGDGIDRALVVRDVGSVVGLGITFPPDDPPQDARIWRIHRGGRLEWVDAQPIAPEPSEAASLFVRTPTSDPSSRTWRSGRYRIDLLVDGAVRRIALEIADSDGSVPEPDDWLATERGLVPVSESNPSGVHGGLFATVEGVGVPIGVIADRPLDEVAAWHDVVDHPAAGATPTVATVYLPRATGLGVMLTNRAFVHLAVLSRLAPSELVPVRPVRGGISDMQGRTPYVVFGAPDGEAMAPGVYAISVSWTDPGGLHASTWHVELRPGPVRPDS